MPLYAIHALDGPGGADKRGAHLARILPMSRRGSSAISSLDLSKMPKVQRLARCWWSRRRTKAMPAPFWTKIPMLRCSYGTRSISPHLPPSLVAGSAVRLGKSSLFHLHVGRGVVDIAPQKPASANLAVNQD